MIPMGDHVRHWSVQRRCVGLTRSVRRSRHLIIKMMKVKVLMIRMKVTVSRMILDDCGGEVGTIAYGD